MQDSFCADATKTILARVSGAISVTERSRARQSRKWRVTYEGGKGGGSRSRFTENKTVLSQFTKNKIGISRFTEKKENVLLLKKNLSTQSHLVKPCKLAVLVDDLGHLGHRVDALPPLWSK